MIFSKKYLFFISFFLLCALASGVSLFLIMKRQRSRGPDEGASATAPKPSTDSTPVPQQIPPHPHGPQTEAWRIPGRLYRLRVKIYNAHERSPVAQIYSTTKLEPIPPDDFTILVRVLPLRHEGDRDIARFQFLPTENVPKYYLDSEWGEKHILEVDVKTGQVVSLHPRDPMPWPVKSFEGEKYLLTPLWEPVDWMLRSADLATVPLEKKYTTTTRDERGEPSKVVKVLEPASVPARSRGSAAKVQSAVRVELITRYARKYRLVQVWVPGEPWWRSFQRYIYDRLDVEAFWEGEEQEKP